jgi:hypothetical protein
MLSFSHKDEEALEANQGISHNAENPLAMLLTSKLPRQPLGVRSMDLNPHFLQDNPNN